ncbi:hypothetical protein QEH56_21210 [Pelagicoccus enzymogenes]|uniref:hypothetical protein n=1 Tax=Pelagicoccus enzymogenes TaxID=2773457 RepID=UPI0028109265|nr:hypothetical protein [Pelagicoccus enzymogenes]MDQ8200700.1 hypothetical protein [Pelagicoccus enzymogenes]
MKTLILLLFTLYLIPTIALAKPDPDAAKKNWDLLLPSKFTWAELSPNGRFLLLYSNLPYDYKQDRNLREKEGRTLVNPTEFIRRGYIWDLKTGTMTLTGPPDKASAGQDFEDRLVETRWTESNTLIMVTGQDFHEYDPESQKTIKSINIHGALDEAWPVSLPSGLDEPMLFRDSKWEQGYKTSLWSYIPSKRKLKRLPAEYVINDVVVRTLEHRGRNAVTIRSNFGEELTGYTYELDEEQVPHTYPMKFPGDWDFYSVKTEHLAANEILAYRRISEGKFVAEARLFDYTTNTMHPASLLMTQFEFEEAVHLLKKPVLDALRASSGPLELSSVSDKAVVQILGDLEKAFPAGSFLIDEPSQTSDRALIRVSTSSRPTGWYILDRKSNKLMKLLEADTTLSERSLSDTRLLSFESEWEPDGNGLVSLSLPPAGQEEIREELIVMIDPQQDLGYAWGFDKYREYLTAEGFSVVAIKLPWSLQLLGAQSNGDTEFAQAQQAASTYIDAALSTVKEAAPELFANPENVHFSLHDAAASFFPAIPSNPQGPSGKAFLVDPRFLTGLHAVPHSQIILAQNFPFDRLFDAKAWSEAAAKLSPPQLKQAVIVGRENNHPYFNSSEQIRHFRKYAEAESIEVAVDRFNWAGYKSLPSWKRNGSIVVAIADFLKDRDSGFSRTKSGSL